MSDWIGKKLKSGYDIFVVVEYVEKPGHNPTLNCEVEGNPKEVDRALDGQREVAAECGRGTLNMSGYGSLPITVLLGKTFIKIDQRGFSEEIVFHTDDGHIYKMYHIQDCCERVILNDIAGDLNDLLNTSIVRAEEPSSLDGFDETKSGSDYEDSFTWTFYILGTNKGTVTLRWLGASNGYYSETVNLEEVVG